MLWKTCIALSMGLLIFACQINDNFELDEAFELEFKETKINRTEDIRIRFSDVLSDNRCPTDVACLWEGNAEVELSLTHDRQSETFRLNTSLEPTSAVVFGFNIELIDLKPPQSTENPPSKEDYTVSLLITKAGNTCDDNSDCRSTSADSKTYCAKADADCDGPGECRSMPDACNDVWMPVCGCDGKTYGNACDAAAAGTNVKYDGECRDSRCDDGQPIICKMMTPVCGESEILAYQNGCYVCVNPATCKPWGEPGCKTNGDCPEDKICDPCGTSSCPQCDDCLPACVPKPAATCDDLANIDFGACEMLLGWAVIKNECRPVSGCSDLGYSFYETESLCIEACLK